MFNLINVVAAAGKRLGFDRNKTRDENADLVRKEITGLELEGAKDVDVDVVGDKLILKGKGLSQAAKEKLLMAAGNIQGVASVEDKLMAAGKETEGRFHTVKSGETLSKIALEHYGKANAYPQIFEANKPMLSSPDKIYPGQLLRIPAAGETLISKEKLAQKTKAVLKKKIPTDA